jgi:hypothetical protein
MTSNWSLTFSRQIKLHNFLLDRCSKFTYDLPISICRRRAGNSLAPLGGFISLPIAQYQTFAATQKRGKVGSKPPFAAKAIKVRLVPEVVLSGKHT